ncbi:hypothetical protein ACFRSX_30205 [Streptomyces goshikiensis]|uniref:hypothetical protein n=1 Tax=Streptomyces TaxID=1883 RepID=UPI00131DCAD6|nr:hypothetical protein [Streptomyces sp. CB02120-2]
MEGLNVTRRTLSIFASLAAIMGSSMVLAPDASAAQYGCPGISVGLNSVVERNSGYIMSQVPVFYDSATGVNCVVNRRTGLGGAGTKAWISVSIWPDGGSVIGDAGNFAAQAGPVKVRAPGKCINVKATTHTVNGDYGDIQFRGFCG